MSNFLSVICNLYCSAIHNSSLYSAYSFSICLFNLSSNPLSLIYLLHFPTRSLQLLLSLLFRLYRMNFYYWFIQFMLALSSIFHCSSYCLCFYHNSALLVRKLVSSFRFSGHKLVLF